ncbi:N-acyl-D-amino-acid deacylase family protein [Anoxynatronum buryatiense]|uniref:N-acyl-D-amino-acid deacylase n=1 Tax=Anoxynatronum buryatiense TaxID=489973 RepID=A0AA46AJN7_9CLOT|nr:amidohydrolase family protein [Anoxynatronum buryatiense]SMP64040.1 N-acyl-D-amino-acid deacylase [Anoxynatronum buryatiense]
MRTVINNGHVIDPGGGIDARLNVGIVDNKISEVVEHTLRGDLEIDAAGLVVSPGFIDLHIHEDPYTQEADRFDVSIFDALLRMGVTTAIGGNCGIGTERPDQYLEAARRLGLPLNVGLLVPHETLRRQTGQSDPYAPASPESIGHMEKLADQYLKAGCLGISFGIRYVPGITEEELSCISRAAQKHHTFIAAHLRDDAHQVMAAAEEFIRIGEKHRLPVQLSHIGSMAGFGQMEAFLAQMDHRAETGLDISADCYPYTAFSTFIGAATYDEGFLERYGITYDAIEIAEGEFQGQRCTEALFHRLRREAPRTLTLAHVMNQTDIDLALQHPLVMIASDGLINGGQGHPRAAGTFPRVLGEYVRERKILTLKQAIEKMTVLPARRLGIAKGTLQVGADADITLFDPVTIADQADFNHPMMPPTGIKGVFVNGRLALQEGKMRIRNAGTAMVNSGASS